MRYPESPLLHAEQAQLSQPFPIGEGLQALQNFGDPLLGPGLCWVFPLCPGLFCTGVPRTGSAVVSPMWDRGEQSHNERQKAPISILSAFQSPLMYIAHFRAYCSSWNQSSSDHSNPQPEGYLALTLLISLLASPRKTIWTLSYKYNFTGWTMKSLWHRPTHRVKQIKIRLGIFHFYQKS